MSARLTQTDLRIINEALALLETEATDDDRTDLEEAAIRKVRVKIWARLST